MYFYVVRILIPHQVTDAARSERPRGNLSDLYPRWLGARELWLHGRNPYDPGVTHEIQEGYYGRPLDAKRLDDPADQQAFAYPAYVTFLLVPTFHAPFEAVRFFFIWLLVALTTASVFWWLRAIGWRPGWTVTAVILLLTLGSFPGLQGVKLQQLSLVVAALVAACAALLVSGHLFAAGVLLAIATIKPQLVVLLSAFLVFWSFSEWRTRRGFLFGFAVTLAALCLGAEWLLPGWMGDFSQAVHDYQRYTGGQSRLDVLLGPVVGKALAFGIVAALAWLGYRIGKVPADHPIFLTFFAAVLAATLVVVPNYAPYNELLLLPAVLILVRQVSDARSDKVLRVAAMASGLFLSWAWVAALALMLASVFQSAESVQRAWAVPLWSEFALAPSILLALTLLLVRAEKFPGQNSIRIDPS
jgi:hypothetical protein